jgi:hypothetical protein
MDTQDLQDNRPSDLPFVEITEKIIGCALEVIHELGTGFLESVYEKALAIALWEKGFQVQCQHPVESFSELNSSCTSCPSMFIHSVRKLMLSSLSLLVRRGSGRWQVDLTDCEPHRAFPPFARTPPG